MSEPFLVRLRSPLIGLAALCPLALVAIVISWAGMDSLQSSPSPAATPTPTPGPAPSPVVPPVPRSLIATGGHFMGAGAPVLLQGTKYLHKPPLISLDVWICTDRLPVIAVSS